MYDVIIQARMGSKRLPGKVLKEAYNTTPLEVLVKRICGIKKISKIILATTNLKKDEKFRQFCKKLKIEIFRGDNLNVLRRYFEAAKKYNSKKIIRLTADCPFVDGNTLCKMIKIFDKNKPNYLSNTYPLPCTFPDGSDIEIFDFQTLKRTYENAVLPSDKEHVTKYMWKSKKFRCDKFNSSKNLSNYRYTIDTLDDFKLFKNIIQKYPKNYDKISMNKIINFIDKNPILIRYQSKIIRNFGWKSSLIKDKIYLKKND